MHISILKDCGFSDNTIKRYCDSNRIIVIDNQVTFIDSSLIVQIFLSMMARDCDVSSFLLVLDDSVEKNYCCFLNYLYMNNFDMAKYYLEILKKSDVSEEFYNNINLYDVILNHNNIDFKIAYDNSPYLEAILSFVKKYIKKRQYKIAEDFFDIVLEKENNVDFKILKSVLHGLETKIEYIVDDSDVVDDVVLQGIRKLERALLVNLELNRNKEFNDINEKLKNIMQYHDVKSYDVITCFVDSFNKVNRDFNIVGKSDMLSGFGEFDDLIFGLLKKQDFYRVLEIVNEYYNQDGFSIKLEIYKLLIDKIILSVKRNMEVLKEEITLYSSEDRVLDFISKYHFSSISIDDIYSNDNCSIDTSINYYKIYEDALENRKYYEARKALLNHEKRMNSLGIVVRIDYLLKELDVLIQNDNDNSLNKKNAKSMLLKATTALENKKYNEAIFFYNEYNKYLKVVDPKIFVLIAKCYINLENYEEAFNYYEVARKVFVYPEVYIGMMECALKLEKYDMVVWYASLYEKYYPDENPYVNYLLSIAYAKVGLYDCALDELSTLECINMTYYNVDVMCIKERNIIEKLKNKIDIEMYAENDFVNYGLSDEEKKIEKKIDSLQKKHKTDLLDVILREYKENQIDYKLEYLFTILKILNCYERDDDVLKLINFIQEIINVNNLSKEKVIEYNHVLSIYKKSNL